MNDAYLVMLAIAGASVVCSFAFCANIVMLRVIVGLERHRRKQAEAEEKKMLVYAQYLEAQIDSDLAELNQLREWKAKILGGLKRGNKPGSAQK